MFVLSSIEPTFFIAAISTTLCKNAATRLIGTMPSLRLDILSSISPKMLCLNFGGIKKIRLKYLKTNSKFKTPLK